MRIAIFAKVRGWHEARLRAALAGRGCEAVRVALEQCSLGAGGIDIPGFDGALPDGAIVRTIDAGSFEQVTFRLAVLHALREAGVVVYNDARMIERTVDKGMTSFLLGRRGVPTPPTWVVEDRAQALAVARREFAAGHRLVSKPLFGSCGKGLVLLDGPEALPSTEQVAGVHYLQRFVAARPQGRDWRVMVVGGLAVAAMERRAKGWIANRARGANCLPAALTPDLCGLAEAAAAAVDVFYGGVDIIRAPDGELLVLEVNGIPAFRGLHDVCDVNIAQCIADDLVRRVAAGAGDAVAASAR